MEIDPGQVWSWQQSSGGALIRSFGLGRCVSSRRSARPVAQVARDLGINPYTLHNVAARMAELGLIVWRRRKPQLLTRQGKRPAAPDLVRQWFAAVAPDVLWCGDVIAIDTDEGKLYLANRTPRLANSPPLGKGRVPHRSQMSKEAARQPDNAVVDVTFGSISAGEYGRYCLLATHDLQGCNARPFPFV
ncbi:hypothetical protein [Nonomuraea sp. NPDC003201]